MKKIRVIGLMSGTSLDGLDIAYCEFTEKAAWSYKIGHAKTIKYTGKWKQKLSNAIRLKGAELQDLDREFGKFIGAETLKFIKAKRLKVDLVASHGHTVFHQPEKGITLQIGSGKHIQEITKLPVICDFRSGDVALGGQGAPLVPMADKLLFLEYDFCLNLGGFANISFNTSKGIRIAFDICPVNIVLNELAGKLGKEFDQGGRMAAKGKIHTGLLKALNGLSFYKVSPPKSLGREWVEKQFSPLLNSFNIPTGDKLRTCVEHFAVQISRAVAPASDLLPRPLLITGGGAYNRFLIGRIAFHANCNIILPDDKTIQFKEAMAFAFLGLLKWQKKINILKSVTGAKKDSSGGKIYV